MKRILLLLLLLFPFVSDAQFGFQSTDERKAAVKVVGAPFTNTDRYTTPDGTGPVLNTTNFTQWLVTVPPRNQSTNNNQFPAGRISLTGGSNQRGFAIKLFQGCFHFMCDQDTWGVAYSLEQKYAQGSNISWSELNKIDVFHFVFRNNVMYPYKNGRPLGVEGTNGPGLSKTGVTFGAPTFGFGIGAAGGTQANNFPYEGGIITTGVSTTTGLTDAQVRAHYEAIRNDPYVGFTGATNLWKAPDAGATWVDAIGGISATRIGNPAITDQVLAFYPPYDITEFVGDTYPIWSPLGPTIKILPIGDSRTFAEASYRIKLHNWAVANGITIVWQGVAGNTPSFINGYGWQERNDGIPGNSTPGQVTGVSLFPPFASEVVTWNPDVVIMWYGQNAGDGSQAASDGERTAFETLLTTAYNNNNNVRFLVLLEISGMRQSAVSGGSVAAKFWDYDAWKIRTVSKYRNLGYKISIADIRRALPWDGPTSDFLPGDKVHPIAPPYASPNDDIGYNKISDKVLPAFVRLMGYQYPDGSIVDHGTEMLHNVLDEDYVPIPVPVEKYQESELIEVPD